ncbi:MAG: two-component regulator propeller domain-containing protein [Bacteroidota bacterium]|nr:two-component regulator propeller domain-containing protein [Bacteroidota bacterium]
MTFNIIRIILVLCALTSCKEQGKKEEKQKQNDTLSIEEKVPKLDDRIWVVYQDKKDNYWFGSNGNGAYCYDGKKLKQFTTKNGLSSNAIRGIQEDKSGNIFFDTPNGVSKFDGGEFISLERIRSPHNQWKLNPDDLWFKGNGDIIGAYRYDGDSLYYLKFPVFNSAYGVYSIYKDKKGNIWFGTLSAGVCRFDGVSLSWIYERELSVLDDGRVPGVRSIIEDKDGNFWLSNILHRYRIYPNDSIAQATIEYEKIKGIESLQQQVKIELPYFNSAVTDNENGDLWMTNYNEGVWKYDGKNLSNYRIKDGETDVLIISIYKDKQGILWLGTDNAGVYKFNGKTFEKFRP